MGVIDIENSLPRWVLNVCIAQKSARWPEVHGRLQCDFYETQGAAETTKRVFLDRGSEPAASLFVVFFFFVGGCCTKEPLPIQLLWWVSSANLPFIPQSISKQSVLKHLRFFIRCPRYSALQKRGDVPDDHLGRWCRVGTRTSEQDKMALLALSTWFSLRWFEIMFYVKVQSSWGCLRWFIVLIIFFSIFVIIIIIVGLSRRPIGE